MSSQSIFIKTKYYQPRDESVVDTHSSNDMEWPKCKLCYIYVHYNVVVHITRHCTDLMECSHIQSYPRIYIHMIDWICKSYIYCHLSDVRLIIQMFPIQLTIKLICCAVEKKDVQQVLIHHKHYWGRIPSIEVPVLFEKGEVSKEYIHLSQKTGSG